MIDGWLLDCERFRATPRMLDGTVGPTLELRPSFEQLLLEAYPANSANR
jgi:hypothetical protein